MITPLEYDCYVKIIAQSVKDGRAELGISQSELANRIGMCRLTVSRIECAVFGMPSIVTCFRLAKLFDISVEKLIGEE